MKSILILIISLLSLASWAQDSANRELTVHNDPAKYRELSAVHAGAGKMGFTQLVGRNDLSTNFLYLHAGAIHAKSGIGHHFHHSIEEMYVLLEGEAEFTVNGRTSTLKAPVAVPCKLGDSHAIYNTGEEPLRWLNYGVSERKAQGDAFDLGDTREEAELDQIPVFVSYQFDQNKLREENHSYSGSGVLARTAFGPEVFSTSWNKVDHLIIHSGKSMEPRQLEGIEEVYYVMKGSGTLTIEGTSKALEADDAFFGLLGETISLENTGDGDLELLVIGVAVSADKNSDYQKVGTESKAMALQMDFVVLKENAEAFEKMYHSIYVPAMTVQEGYLGSKLLRLFPDEVAKSIEAEPTTFNYQIQISFDTEENRRKWVASPQHQIAWPAASELAEEFKWRGYDVMGEDDQR
ncbi:cupin domain-containing protein [Algoriphagus sp. AGSA1]|uniref:cupin domain-containing protein n=1 Tax=Algoriphagus sp. AGSA1 TaxID=2907213 RepID=UPI001F1E9401|nr:cupin domain-containing protein [Algoriphagus sp. AGSA1]MCE7053632.1 cupin domain-containing protein [Algoriphagus sp. AGSA1]